jgi:hypothetical protein
MRFIMGSLYDFFNSLKEKLTYKIGHLLYKTSRIIIFH